MASGFYHYPDGADATMDVLGQAVEEMDEHPCPFLIYPERRDPDTGFEPAEYCDAPVKDADGTYCAAHAWATD